MICYIDVISDRVSSFSYMQDTDCAVLCNECAVRCCFQYLIEGGIVQTTGILLARCANHSVSIDLSNENVASTVLSFYRYPMQLLRTSVP